MSIRHPDEDWPIDPETGEPNDPNDPLSPINLRREASTRHPRIPHGFVRYHRLEQLRERIARPEIVQSTKTIEVEIPPTSSTLCELPGVGSRPVHIDEIAIRVLEGNPDALLVSFDTTERPGYVNRVLLPVDWFDARLKSAERYRKLARVVLTPGMRDFTVDCINHSEKHGRLLIVANLTFPL